MKTVLQFGSLVMLLGSSLLNGCSMPVHTALGSNPAPGSSSPILPALPQAQVQQASQSVLLLLQQRNLKQLAQWVHPQQGVRFSPYVHVTARDLRFLPAELVPLQTGNTVYHWGAFDGSGDPINLSFNQYWQKFIFRQDYTHAPTQQITSRPTQRGNSLNTIQQFYPDSLTMEYHWPASASQPLDWSSLILVFQPYQGRWYLVGVVHDQWTI